MTCTCGHRHGSHHYHTGQGNTGKCLVRDCNCTAWEAT